MKFLHHPDRMPCDQTAEDAGVNSPSNGQFELHGWKEIADYLGICVRAAQKWEKERGLPVRRLVGEKGRVFVTTEELEKWKVTVTRQPLVAGVDSEATTAPNSELMAGSTSTHAKFARKWVRLSLAGFLVVVLLTLLGYAVIHFQHGPPAQWKVEGNTLFISDAMGREIWHKTFQEQLDESYTGPINSYRVWIGDLSGKGEVETLFTMVYYRSKSVLNGVIICFSAKGDEKWRFKPGKAVSTVTETFPDDYWPVNLIVAPMGKGRPNSIVVSSIQNNLYPTQIALLSPDGKLRREYWHSGIIGFPGEGDIFIADLDGNGTNEIYLGGVDNAYEQATLVVLDPETMGGASKEEVPKYQFLGLGDGREIARVLFPKSCVTRVLTRFSGVSMLDFVYNRIRVSIPISPKSPSIVYDLSPVDFQVLKLEWGLYYERMHIQLSSEGRLDHKWSPDREESQLRKLCIIRPSHAVQNAVKASSR